MASNFSQSKQFDHEKLDAYQLSLRFIAWVTPLMDEVSGRNMARVREALDQLDRASLSILLNVAEGNGRRQRQTRAKFFDDARGSATECAACLDALVAKMAITPERVREGKEVLLRVVSTLCGLIERFDSNDRLQDDVVEYRIDAEASRTRTTTRKRTKI